MHKNYGTNRKAIEFTNHHEPKPDKKSCCSACSPALVFRFMLRTAIPILLGLASGVFVEWAERKSGIHQSDTVVEFSDFSACAITLLTTYTLNTLLNCCWPTNPYQNNDFFQSAGPQQDPSELHLDIHGL